jgi:prepilin-type processing-associated H-X9-DG protein
MKCPSCGATLPAQDLDCTRCGAHVGWYVRSAGGGEDGPYSFLELQTLVRQERVSPSDEVRVGVMGAWQPAPEILRPEPGAVASPESGASTRQRPARRTRPVALWALLGLLTIVLLIPGGLLIVRARARTPERRMRQACLSNLRSLSSALRMYASDNDGRFPYWPAWGAAALRHTDTVPAFQCPATPDQPGYAYNAALGGVAVDIVSKPQDCAMLWDAGALGPSVGLPTGYSPPRHDGGDNYAFVDGHTAWRRRGSSVRVTVQSGGR